MSEETKDNNEGLEWRERVLYPWIQEVLAPFIGSNVYTLWSTTMVNLNHLFKKTREVVEYVIQSQHVQQSQWQAVGLASLVYSLQVLHYDELLPYDIRFRGRELASYCADAYTGEEFCKWLFSCIENNMHSKVFQLKKLPLYDSFDMKCGTMTLDDLHAFTLNHGLEFDENWSITKARRKISKQIRIRNEEEQNKLYKATEDLSCEICSD